MLSKYSRGIIKYEMKVFRACGTLTNKFYILETTEKRHKIIKQINKIN